jgi:diacylglycerol kinase (ATP)
MKWLDAPLDEPPPVLSRRAGEVRLLWRDEPSRLDDKSFDNGDKTHTAEIACDAGTVRVLIPRKLPVQKVVEEKAETA